MTGADDNSKEQDSPLIAPYAWSMPGWASERQSPDENALEVWGYAERFSYAPGEVLKLHVSCSQPTYSVTITRDGLEPEIVWRKSGIAGRRHEAPEDSYAQGCGWPVGLEIPIGDAWRPGFYLVALIVDGEEDRFESEAFFVLRKPPGSRGGVALLLTTSTLIAYNDWGGANHYRGIGDNPRVEIASPVLSTRRPMSRGFLRKPPEAPRESHTFSPPMFWQPRYPAYEWARLYGYGRHHADAFWATYERPFVIWAEEQGYDLDYLTQHDLHFEERSLDGYTTVVIVGHDEYWTWEMRDRIDEFVDRGGGLARFAGNFLWQVRLSDDGNTQYCYRTPDKDPEAASNPLRTTTVWDYKRLGRPAAATMGLTGMGGTYNRYGLRRPDHPADSPSTGPTTGRSREPTSTTAIFWVALRSISPRSSWIPSSTPFAGVFPIPPSRMGHPRRSRFSPSPLRCAARRIGSGGVCRSMAQWRKLPRPCAHWVTTCPNIIASWKGAGPA